MSDQELCGFKNSLGPVDPGRNDTFIQATARMHATTENDNVSLKIALLQLDPCHANNECLATAVQWLHTAKDRGADVAVLPEMWSVGYGAQFPGYHRSNNASRIAAAYAWTRLATPRDGEYLTKLKDVAKSLDIAIAAAMLQEDVTSQGVGGGPPRNSGE